MSEKNNNSTTETTTETEKVNRGRQPLTVAKVQERLANPNPVDIAFVDWAEKTFGGQNTSVQIGILARNATVRSWFSDSNEHMEAQNEMYAFAAQLELNSKLAKMAPTERATFDAADEATQAFILRLLTV